MSDNTSDSDDALVSAFQNLRIRHRSELAALLARHAQESAQLEDTSRRSLRIAAQRRDRDSLLAQRPPPPAPVARSRSGPPAVDCNDHPLQVGDLVIINTPGRIGRIGDHATIIKQTRARTPSFQLRLGYTKTPATRNGTSLTFVCTPTP